MMSVRSADDDSTSDSFADDVAIISVVPERVNSFSAMTFNSLEDSKTTGSHSTLLRLITVTLFDLQIRQQTTREGQR
jgi:hypothetical protein